jgi:hypothetical protein
MEMTRREFVAIFAVACAVFAASAEMIDVLSLGAKNDGSEDVSAIVNANTSRGPAVVAYGRPC